AMQDSLIAMQEKHPEAFVQGGASPAFHNAGGRCEFPAPLFADRLTDHSADPHRQHARLSLVHGILMPPPYEVAMFISGAVLTLSLAPKLKGTDDASVSENVDPGRRLCSLPGGHDACFCRSIR